MTIRMAARDGLLVLVVLETGKPNPMNSHPGDCIPIQ